MKVSLKYLFLGIFIPLFALGLAIGLGKYFNVIKFLTPQDNVVKTLFINTLYLAIFNTFYQLICEEPAFRGLIAQRLSNTGMLKPAIISSFIYALWHIVILLFMPVGMLKIIFTFAERLIMGCLFALLFIKGRNLLIPAVCNGIISAIKLSLFTGGEHIVFIVFWLGCLTLGAILILIIPEKAREVRKQWQRA